MEAMNNAIKLAIEKGGYKPEYADHKIGKANKRFGVWFEKDNHSSYFDFKSAILDPLFWQALGRALGWSKSKYQMVELIEPFYSARSDVKGVRGVIVGKGRNKPPDEIYYVLWDGFKSRRPYPVENLRVFPKTRNWQMVAHKYFDLVLTGGDREKFWSDLTRDA